MTVTSNGARHEPMHAAAQCPPGPTGHWHYHLMIKRGCSESALARAYNRGPSRRPGGRSLPVICPATARAGDELPRPRPRFVRNLNRG